MMVAADNSGTLDDPRAGVGIVAIVRLRRQPVPDAVADALRAGGVGHAEITLPTPGALQTIARWQEREGLVVGAGTVRTAADARAAILAGARFLVTPTLDHAVLDAAAEHGVPVYCGAATPTEIDHAYRHRAVAAVKVFPAGVLGGARYITAVREPLHDVPLLPTGGVGAAEAREYARLGCVGVGVGGHLVDDDVVATAAWDRLEQRAAELVAAWSAGLDEVPA